MRTFIAIDLPEAIKDKIAELENDFKKLDLGFRWVKPENLHLTLKFLGDVKPEQIDAIKKAITKVSDEFSVFKTRLDGFGFFPDKKKPRVFFIGTDREELFRSIAAELETALAEIGFAKEDRFKSHITLARIKDSRNIGFLNKKIATNVSVGIFPVEAISLYKSTITGQGPVYEKIFKRNLTA